MDGSPPPDALSLPAPDLRVSCSPLGPPPWQALSSPAPATRRSGDRGRRWRQRLRGDRGLRTSNSASSSMPVDGARCSRSVEAAEPREFPFPVDRDPAAPGRRHVMRLDPVGSERLARELPTCCVVRQFGPAARCRSRPVPAAYATSWAWKSCVHVCPSRGLTTSRERHPPATPGGSRRCGRSGRIRRRPGGSRPAVRPVAVEKARQLLRSACSVHQQLVLTIALADAYEQGHDRIPIIGPLSSCRRLSRRACHRRAADTRNLQNARTMRPLAPLTCSHSRSPSLRRFALLAGGSSAAQPRPSAKLVEVVVTLPRPSLAVEVAHNRTLAATALRGHPLAVRAPAAVSYLRTLAATPAHARGAARRGDSGSRHPLALRRRARRRLGRPPRIRSGAPARAAGRDRLADGDVSHAARRPRIDLRRDREPGTCPDRRHGALGSLPRHRGTGRQDRTVDDGIDQAHPYFDAVRPLVPRRLPEGEHGLHHAEGHRRARVPLTVHPLEVRGPAVRPRLLLPRDARRRDRGRRLRHADPGRRRSPHLGRCAEGVSRQLQGADSADGGLRPRR